MSKPITAFQQYVLDHPEMTAEAALGVFRLYDNYEMSEDDAVSTMLDEVEELIETGGDSVPSESLDTLNEIIILHATPSAPTPPVPSADKTPGTPIVEDAKTK